MGWRADIAGKRILLVAEQGYGDTIQFARFARHVTARGAHAILGVRPALRHLLAELGEIAVQDEPEPVYDGDSPLMSQPARLGPASRAFATDGPYLHADPAAVAGWRAGFPHAGPEDRPGLGRRALKGRSHPVPHGPAPLHPIQPACPPAG